MQLAKSARYALYAAVEMVLAGDGLVTVADLAKRYGIPPGALAKALQSLVRAGIAAGTRGVGGGYRLARPAREVTVLDVVNVFQPLQAEGQCLLLGGEICTERAACRLGLLLDEVDELIRCTFASVTLETLARSPVAGGRGR